MIDDAAVSAAISEAKTEVSEAPEVTPEPEVAATESTEPAASPEPAEDEVFVPSAADLQIINENPHLKKVYKSMQKGFTQKMQGLATTRKELEEKASVADWIKADPQNAVRSLATAMGLSVAQAERKAEQAIVDDLQEEWSQSVGPKAAQLLRPLFEKTAKALIDAQVKPLQERAEALSRESQERSIAATTREFGALITERGEEWNDEIKDEMAKIVPLIRPNDDTPLNEYLATVYDAVIARRTRQKGLRTQIDRLKNSKETVEPSAAGKVPATVADKVTADMSEKEAISLAVKQAKAQLGR